MVVAQGQPALQSIKSDRVLYRGRLELGVGV